MFIEFIMSYYTDCHVLSFLTHLKGRMAISCMAVALSLEVDNNSSHYITDV